MDLTGLAAATWDGFAGDEPKRDYYVYGRLIAQHPGRVLDVGCGTGRILVPYLADGIDIEGIDSSQEALSICRENAARKGLTATLYEQRMEALDLPNRYSTIIVPGGSFHLLIEREDAAKALKRFNEHLEANGVLALSLDDPSEQLSIDIGRWRSRGVVTRPDGTELHQDRMTERIDRAEQVVRGEQVVQEQVHTMRMRLYLKDEIQVMLKHAGFRDVAAIEDDGGGSSETRWMPRLVAFK